MSAPHHPGAAFFRTPEPQRPCPDCLADVEVSETSPGVYMALVKHDPSCPAYQRIPGQARGAPVSDFGMPHKLAHDWVNLVSLVDHYAERQQIPCRDGAKASEKWTSERKADQAAVAPECARCPALIACRRYGVAHPNEVGTYGGLTQDERRALVRGRKGKK